MKHYTVEITNEALAERIGIMESEISIRYSPELQAETGNKKIN